MTTILIITSKPKDNCKNIKDCISAIPVSNSCKTTYTILVDKVEILIKTKTKNECYIATNSFLESFDNTTCELLEFIEKTNGKVIKYL